MNRRSNGVVPIPDEVQEGMRSRLRHIRETRGLNRAQVTSLTGGTLAHYERNDISTFRIGDLCALGTEFGLDPQEFINYLFDGVETETTSASSRMKRMNVYMQSLSSKDQELAISLVQQVVQHSIDERAAQSAERRAQGSPRERLQEAMGRVELDGHS